jgi:subtilase family serine protease
MKQFPRKLFGARGKARPNARRPRSVRLGVERLDDRVLLSSGALGSALDSPVVSYPNQPASSDRTVAPAADGQFAPACTLAHGAGDGIQPAGPMGPVGYTPSQVRHAYGFDQILFSKSTGSPQFPFVFAPGNGYGQTIAIVDAYDDLTALSDLNAFSSTFNLPQMNGNGGPTFTKATPQGQPLADPTGGKWAAEIALDVEWAHAIAPQANILLVEAKSANDLLGAVDYARQQPGVSVVSMSWGGPEFSSETTYDATFQTPANHSGVSFVASSGDDGAPALWPSVSGNVLSVGGTHLNIDASGNYLSETGWSGSGGGSSTYEAKPSYQNNVPLSATKRMAPDVAYDADLNTGFAVYSTANGGWIEVGGTSAGAPQWAALLAIANQGRAFYGKGLLYPKWAQNALYLTSSSSAFHDITSGNNGFAAGPGYDLVTGLGSPKAPSVVSALVNYSYFGPFSLETSSSTSSAADAASPAGTAESPSRTAALLAPSAVDAVFGRVDAPRFLSDLTRLPTGDPFNASPEGDAHRPPPVSPRAADRDVLAQVSNSPGVAQRGSFYLSGPGSSAEFAPTAAPGDDGTFVVDFGTLGQEPQGSGV